MQGAFKAIQISASGLTAERLRLDTIANNLANINTTRTAKGGPYKRQSLVFAERLEKAKGPKKYQIAGVKVAKIVEDQGEPRKVFDPNHPDAREDGYVHYPDINVVNEMVDMITATRAYEANITAVNAAKTMALKALEIGRG